MSAREALIFDVNDGMSVSEAVEEHGVARSCAYKWVSRYQRLGWPVWRSCREGLSSS